MITGYYHLNFKFSCLACDRKCIRKYKYHKIKNIKKCFIKDKILIIDSLEKIYNLLDIVESQFKNVSLINILHTHLGICPNIFLNEFTNSVFERYYWEKNYNQSSFGCFEDIPVWWKQIKKVIDSEILLIEEIKQKEFEQKQKLKK